MAWFGLDQALDKPVVEARAAVSETMQKLGPMLDEVEMRAGGILDTLLTRVGGAKITITIEIPKAGADWVKTPPA